MKADCQRRPRLREFIKHSLDAQTRRNGCSLPTGGQTGGKEELKLWRLDDSIYIVYYDGDLFRAYHSDVAETPFATV